MSQVVYVVTYGDWNYRHNKVFSKLEAAKNYILTVIDPSLDKAEYYDEIEDDFWGWRKGNDNSVYIEKHLVE